MVTGSASGYTPRVRTSAAVKIAVPVSRLTQPHTLSAGKTLLSPNGRYRLTQQAGGNPCHVDRRQAGPHLGPGGAQLPQRLERHLHEQGGVLPLHHHPRGREELGDPLRTPEIVRVALVRPVGQRADVVRADLKNLERLRSFVKDEA